MEHKLTKVPEAIDALKTLAKKQPEELITEAQKINLILGFKKPPGEALKKFIKITLPNLPIREDSEICLFVKDVKKAPRDYQPTIDKYEQLFEEKKVTCINTIIPLKSIKTEFKEYEAKINLARMYDVYLADERIFRLLPSFLGKHFHKKFPTQVDLTKDELASEVQRALRVTQCQISGRGSTCMLSVGHVGMSKDDVMANITEAVERLSAEIPGGWANIKSLHVKTQLSAALPIYMSLDAPTDVVLPEAAKQEGWEPAEDVSTIEGVRVRVRPSTSDFMLVGDNRRKRKRLSRKKRRQEKDTTRSGGAKKRKVNDETPNDQDDKASEASNKENNADDSATPSKKTKKQKPKDVTEKVQPEPSSAEKKNETSKANSEPAKKGTPKAQRKNAQKSPKAVAETPEEPKANAEPKNKGTPKAQQKNAKKGPKAVAATPEEPKAKKQRVSVDSPKTEITPKSAKFNKTPKSVIKTETPKSAKNRKVSDSETPKDVSTPKTPKNTKTPKSIEKKTSAKKQMSAKKKSPKTMKSS